MVCIVRGCSGQSQSLRAVRDGCVGRMRIQNESTFGFLLAVSRSAFFVTTLAPPDSAEGKLRISKVLSDECKHRRMGT